MTATAVSHQVASARLHVVEAGQGPTLGYVHGILGTPTESAFVSALAERGWHVIAPNLAGFAGSDPLLCRNFFDWIGHLSEVIDVCGLTGAPVVASSVGAMIAVELAALRPEAFPELVLIGPLGLWLDEHPIHDLWSERSAHLTQYLLSDPALALIGEAEADADPRSDLDRELRRYRTMRAAASLMWPLPDRGVAERLYRVRCRTHIVWGAHDRLADASAYTAAWQATLLNPGTHWLIDGAGHLAEWDAPEAVAQAVTDALHSPLP